MGLRETLNQNPAIATGATIAIIVVAVGFIVYSQMGPSSTGKAPDKLYFTIDEGKTYFADDAKKLPPFDHEGKEAYRAHLFKCADGKEFVGYIERYTPDAKKKLEELKAASAAAAANKGTGPVNPGQMQGLAMAAQMGVEVKKPGDAKWTKMMDFQNSTRIRQVGCPDGKMEGLEEINP